MNKRKVISTVILAVLIVALAAAGYSVSHSVIPVDPPDGVMRAVFFDVGYNDCALFYTKDASVLIGSPHGKCSKIAGYLKRAGIETIDYFIVPDYKNENCADSKKITQRFKVENLLLPLSYDGGKTNYLTLKATNKSSVVIDIYAGQSYRAGGIGIEVLSPTDEPASSSDGGAAVRVTYGENAVLWFADINGEQVKKVTDAFPYGLSCDIIKLPMHGSGGSCSEDLLGLSGAEYAVISCGKNVYGHPSKETAKRLEDAGMETAITQSDGTVVFDISGKGVERIR